MEYTQEERLYKFYGDLFKNSVEIVNKQGYIKFDLNVCKQIELFLKTKKNQKNTYSMFSYHAMIESVYNALTDFMLCGIPEAQKSFYKSKYECYNCGKKNLDKDLENLSKRTYNILRKQYLLCEKCNITDHLEKYNMKEIKEHALKDAFFWWIKRLHYFHGYTNEILQTLKDSII